MKLPLLGEIGFLSKADYTNLRRSLKYLKAYRVRFFITILVILIGLGLHIVQPYFFGRLVDLLAGGGGDRVSWLVGLVFFLYLAASFFSLIETFLTIEINNRIILDIKQDMYVKVLDLPMKVFDRVPAGEFMSRIEGDAANLSNILVRRSLSIIVDVGKVVGIGILLFKLNFQLTLLAITLFPVSLFVFSLFGRILRRLSLKGRELNDRYFSFLNEAIAGMKEIKALGIQSIIKGKFDQFNQNIIDLNIRVAKVDSISVFSNMIIGGIALYLIILLAAHQIVNGSFGLGAFVAYYSYVAQFYGAMRNFTQLSSTIQGSLVSIGRIYDLLDSFFVSPIAEGSRLPGKGETRIEFTNVTFGYDDERAVLRDFTFAFPSNQIIAIVGENGSGKSTLFNLLLRFYEPDGGGIFYNGIDIRELDLKAWRGKSAFLLQEPIIFRGTVRENLSYARENATKEEMIAVCRKVGIHEYVEGLPNGYDTELGSKFKLSTGEKQRLSIARSLLKDTDIFLFDEMTSALDGEAENCVLEVIQELGKHKTVILIAHRLSTINIADFVVVIDEGRVVQTGSPAKLLEEDGVYRNLLGVKLEVS